MTRALVRAETRPFERAASLPSFPAKHLGAASHAGLKTARSRRQSAQLKFRAGPLVLAASAVASNFRQKRPIGRGTRISRVPRASCPRQTPPVHPSHPAGLRAFPAQRPKSPLRRASRHVICDECCAISRRSRRQTRPRRVRRASRAAAPSSRPVAMRPGHAAQAAGVRCGILLGAGQSRVSLPIATRARARPVTRGYRSASGRDWAPPIISGSSCETKLGLIASPFRRFH